MRGMVLEDKMKMKTKRKRNQQGLSRSISGFIDAYRQCSVNVDVLGSHGLARRSRALGGSRGDL